MDCPIHVAAQFTPHLKSLRKLKGLTQAQLGRLMGLSQVRIAEIEKNPAAISVDQMIRLLAALDTQVVLKPALRAKAEGQKLASKQNTQAVW